MPEGTQLPVIIVQDSGEEPDLLGTADARIV